MSSSLFLYISYHPSIISFDLLFQMGHQIKQIRYHAIMWLMRLTININSPTTFDHYLQLQFQILVVLVKMPLISCWLCKDHCMCRMLPIITILLPPVVYTSAHVLFTLFVFVSGVQHILCCVFVLFFSVLCTPMLPVSLIITCRALGTRSPYFNKCKYTTYQ